VLDREPPRAFLKKEHPFVGLKRHMRIPTEEAGRRLAEELSGYVEIHAFRGGYCGLSFIETGEVNACMLLEKRFLKSLPSTRWETVSRALMGANPRLRSRLETLEPSDDVVQSVGQVPFTQKERSLWPLIYTGDAAGVIVPLCGDGQAMALQSALLLAELVRAAPPVPSREDFERLGRNWERRWKKEFQRRVYTGWALQVLLFRPRLADILLGTLRLCPAITGYLVRATRGAA
jgi:2-polyprenyl-6-methoxyphenol hydroxylase-like FAD-dependent oxidoreductase